MNIHRIRRYYSRLSESYCKNQLTSVTLLLMTLPWQIHLPISLPARLIKYIMSLLKEKYALGLPLQTPLAVCGAEFCNLAEVTQDEIKKFSRKSISKSCELDPLPAVVLKGCLTVLLPTITRIINLSLSTSVMPDALKVAILSPMLKKSDADFEQFQNFHPISNLKVLSKLSSLRNTVVSFLVRNLVLNLFVLLEVFKA